MSHEVKGLTIVWDALGSESAPNRLVFEMALVQLALGGKLTLYVTGMAIAHLAQATSKRDQLIPKLAEVPQIHALLDEVLDGGAQVIVCQTAAAGRITMSKLDPRIEAGGLVSLMQGLGDDRLVVI
jgi:predicted peroxiredoxin